MLAAAMSPFLVAGVIVLGGSSAQAASLTPNSLLTSALANAKGSNWVHEAVTVTGPSGVLYTASNDVGTTRGRQSLRTASGETATLLAFDAGKKLYERASIGEVSSWLGIKTTTPIKYANQWYVITPKDPIYFSTASGTTLATDFGGWRFTTALRYGSNATLNGRVVRTLVGTQVTGAATVNVTIYITKSGEVLPVAVRTRTGDTTYLTEWSNWGRFVYFGAPGGALPYPR